MDQFIVFTDLHGHLWRKLSPELFPDGSTTRLHEVCDVLRQIREYCGKHKIGLALFAGDMLHTKSNVNVIVLNALLEELELFGSIGCEIIGIPGNHDLAVRNGLSHALTPFRWVMSVIDEPRWIHRGPGVAFLCIPHQECGEKVPGIMREMLSKYEPSPSFTHATKKVALIHQWLDELMFKHHRISGLGDFNLADLPLDQFDYIFSGHHHIHDSMMNYVDVGSPLQHNFGDAGYEKGFLHVRLGRGKEKQFEFIPLAAPRFVKVRYGDSRSLPLVKGNYIRVVADRDVSSKVKELYGKLGPRSISFESSSKTESAEMGEALSRSVSLSPREVFAGYLGDGPAELNRDLLLKLGTEVLGEVLGEVA